MFCLIMSTRSPYYATFRTLHRIFLQLFEAYRIMFLQFFRALPNFVCATSEAHEPCGRTYGLTVQNAANTSRAEALSRKLRVVGSGTLRLAGFPKLVFKFFHVVGLEVERLVVAPASQRTKIITPDFLPEEIS